MIWLGKTDIPFVVVFLFSDFLELGCWFCFIAVELLEKFKNHCQTWKSFIQVDKGKICSYQLLLGMITITRSSAQIEFYWYPILKFSFCFQFSKFANFNAGAKEPAVCWHVCCECPTYFPGLLGWGFWIKLHGGCRFHRCSFILALSYQTVF